MSTLWAFLLLLSLISSTLLLPVVTRLNERPIIGILAQEVTDDVFLPFGKTYIAASYVHFLESAGCRVAPIQLNLSEDKYVKLFKSINGILFPGGAVDLLTSDFARTAGIFFKLATESTSDGKDFPIWGTCMGFQVLTALAAGKNLLERMSAVNISLPLNLVNDVSSSRMFQNASPELLNILQHENVTANFHHYGITPKSFLENKNLSSFYRILSTNFDRDGVEFVSSIEARNFPIYGVQWHPEVNRFQWNKGEAYPHSVDAIRVSEYMADFFVNEARKSFHSFNSEKEEEQSLIYNYVPKYTANISGYEQAYFF
uniref:folate gamma-glutamyl hydrolase n=1 Tax=Leptobrachium leishanense TaxID=445787 RepID=A0A8C5R1Y9_9ANUR